MGEGCVFYVVGGDSRSCYLSLHLAKNNKVVFHFDPYDVDILRHSNVTIITGASGVGFKRLIQGECAAREHMSKVLILPVPVTKDGEFINGKSLLTVGSISEAACDFDMVFGGTIPSDFIKKADASPYVFDYMKDDYVATENAVATAEGAIIDAALMSNVNIYNSTCLVAGYGRCAKAIAKRLYSWGADVIIVARRSVQRKEAALNGYKVMSFEETCSYRNILSKVDFCFNTVPALVVCEDILSNLASNVVVVDVASKPGGVDFNYLKECNIPYKHSLGIPGKISPKSSGIILAEATLKEIDACKHVNS